MKMLLKMHLTDFKWKRKKMGSVIIYDKSKICGKCKPTKEKCITINNRDKEIHTIHTQQMLLWTAKYIGFQSCYGKVQNVKYIQH
jgi:hypothetical protein